MNLLSDNDWNSLAVSLRKMNEITLVRTFGDVTVEASTCHVKKGWTVAMVVNVRVMSAGITQSQNFESVEAAQNAIRGWVV